VVVQVRLFIAAIYAYKRTIDLQEGENQVK
jgi:hypothetical protein